VLAGLGGNVYVNTFIAGIGILVSISGRDWVNFVQLLDSYSQLCVNSVPLLLSLLLQLKIIDLQAQPVWVSLIFIILLLVLFFTCVAGGKWYNLDSMAITTYFVKRIKMRMCIQ
jgi:hypothetical protein